MRKRLSIALAALLLGGCATTEEVAPVRTLATAGAAISQAEQAGALQSAPVELIAARSKLSRAEAAARAERHAEARRLAEQAEADAALAERKARAARAQSAAAELARANEMLRSETLRQTR